MEDIVALAVMIVLAVFLIGIVVVAYTEHRIKVHRAELWQIIEDWMRVEEDPKITRFTKK